MRAHLRVLCAVAVAAVLVAAANDITDLAQVFSFQQSGDTTIFGAAVATQTTARQIPELTGAFGVRATESSSPYTIDSNVRINTMGELLVVAAALKLIDSSALPISLDSPIPTQYLPRGVTFANPNSPSNPLTMQMLMMHTSTISDARFNTFTTNAPTATLDLRSFVESYFLTSSGGTFRLADGVFTTGATPGALASYSYARANTALLHYIVEQAIIAVPGLVSSTEKTALAYIHEQILAPLGMSNTFVRHRTGTFPKVTLPGGASTTLYSGSVVEDVTSTGGVATTTTLHPAVFSDYMTYSTVSDLNKLARHLFVATNGLLNSVGTRMKGAMQTISTSTPPVTGFRGQGLGLMFFDGAAICAAAQATQIATRCPLTTDSRVWGFQGNGEYSQVGLYCAEIAAGTTTCAVTAHSFRATGTTALKSNDLSYAMAGTAMQFAAGDTSTLSQTTTVTNGRNSLYGVWVFLGVLGVVAFVIVASYFTEYIIQPAPPLGAQIVPASMMPPVDGGSAYGAGPAAYGDDGAGPGPAPAAYYE